MSKFLFVGGCNRALPLTATSPFALADSANCTTQAIIAAKTHEEAKAICKQCEHTQIPSYLEQHVEEAEIVAPEINPHVVEGPTIPSRLDMHDMGFVMTKRVHLVGVPQTGYAVFFWTNTDGRWILEYFPCQGGVRRLATTAEEQLELHREINAPAPERAKPAEDIVRVENTFTQPLVAETTTPTPAARPAPAAPAPAPVVESENPAPPNRDDLHDSPQTQIEFNQPAPTPAPDAPVPGNSMATAIAQLATVAKQHSLPPLETLYPLVGKSLFGPTTVRDFRSCLRKAFYRHVIGLSKTRQAEIVYPDSGKVKVDAMTLGALVHAQLERHYEQRAVRDEAWQKVEEVYPTIAKEAVRLYLQYVDRYAIHERNIWDVRFVELESRAALPKRRVKALGKQVELLVTCRTDLAVREMKSGEGRLSPGTPAAKIQLWDHKTTAKMYANIGDAWQHEAQVFQNLEVYNRGRGLNADGTLNTLLNVERFGPAEEFGVTMIGKAEQHDPNKHLKRFVTKPSRALLDAFWADTADFIYGAVAERLFHKAYLQEDTWPKSYQCRDPVTGFTCPYLMICSHGGMEHFTPDGLFPVRQPMDRDALIAPKRKRARKGKTAAEVEGK